MGERKLLQVITLGLVYILGFPGIGSGSMEHDSTKSAFAGAEDPGGKPVNLLFIHHSCGGHLMADPGPQVDGGIDSGDRCIYVSHPNGGGLRTALEAEGFVVNEASYGSMVGEDTDIRHWNTKFRDHMDRILHTQKQDTLLPEGVINQIVAFKSCFPNNALTDRGAEPGNPDGPDLTVANAKAAYRVLLPYFREHPDVLYIAFTAPPLADRKPVGLKQKIKAMFKGNPKHPKLALEFNRWLVDAEQGWLVGYDLPNVAVFDYFGLLADPVTGWSAYPTQEGQDSHPSSVGNAKAAEAFVVFLERIFRAAP